jgi:hypothetical protein
MLAVILTALLTWCSFAIIGTMLSDVSFKDCMTNGGTLMLMCIFGWIPSVIVGVDMHERLEL